MTWALFSDMARQFYNCWSTCVKLAWELDRGTKTYFVDHLLAGGQPSLRASVLACYGSFYASVSQSSALEVRTIACVAAADIRSTTGTNLHGIFRDTGLGPKENVQQVCVALLNKKTQVPKTDGWRMPCLQKFLNEKYRLAALGEDCNDVENLIKSLVTS